MVRKGCGLTRKSIQMIGQPALLLLSSLSVYSQSPVPPCPTLFAPTNFSTLSISAPWASTGDYSAQHNPSYLALHVTSAPSTVPVGDYLAWCVDFADGISANLTSYSALLFASCDPGLNEEIGVGYPNSVYVSPQLWQEVNYLLNHKNGAYFWNFQMAIWSLVGGPPTTNEFSSPYPPTDFDQVSALLADAQTNAHAWQPKSGDKLAIIVQIPRAAPQIQLVILELPYGGPPPKLTIIPDGPNVILQWPASSTGWTLQSSPGCLSPLVWTTLPATPAVINGQNVISNIMTAPQQLYRLIQ